MVKLSNFLTSAKVLDGLIFLTMILTEIKMRSILATVTMICLTAPAFAESDAKTAEAVKNAPNKAAAEAAKVEAVNDRISKAEEKASTDANAEKKPAKNVKAAKAKAAKEAAKTQTLPSGLVIEDVKVGSGKEAKLNSKIKVHYKGTFKKDGKTFDSSYDRNEPIEFMLAEGQLIKGWTDGIPGMKVGGKRKLSIPYALAYGENGRPPAIPEKSDLNFEVELLDVK
jgi:FK506-binding nuclear protein